MTEDIPEIFMRQVSQLQIDVKYWREFGKFFLKEYCHLQDVALYEAWLAFEQWYDNEQSQNNNG